MKKRRNIGTGAIDWQSIQASDQGSGDAAFAAPAGKSTPATAKTNPSRLPL
jgi:hypothetical protein